MKKIDKSPFERKQKGVIVTLCIHYFVFAAILLVGCKKEDDHNILLTVLDTPNYSFQFGENTGDVEITTSMVVKEAGASAEQNLDLHAIKSFSYEKGYEYLLKVKSTPNDHEGYIYSLIEVVSKTLTGEIETVITVTVRTSRTYYAPEMYAEVMVIKEDESGLQLSNGFRINGFNYENGYEYRLKVKKSIVNMPVSSGMLYYYLYELVEIISKTPQNFS